MRRAYFLIFLISATFFSSCKKDLLQFGHVWQLTSNTTRRLNNICMPENGTYIIGGGSTFYNATMLRSSDDGFTWTADSSTDAPKELYGMGISPDGTVYLSGIDGIVLSSTDKGKSWKHHRIDNWLVHVGGCFFTPNTGIFASTVLQRQSTITRVDSNYKIIDEKTFEFGLNKLYMVDENTGYALGYGVVLKTTDRGATWIYLNVDGDNFTSMTMYGGKIWICGSAGSIFSSTDNGASWQRLRNGNDLSVHRIMLRNILFTDATHGWAAGDEGVVLYTNNGGQNWMEYERFTSKTLRSIAMCYDGNVLMAGDDGVIFRIAQ